MGLYTDPNGVRWTVVSTGRSMLATVLDTAQPNYYPPAEDLAQPIVQIDGDGDAATAEVSAFNALTARIDQYAREHAAGLQVSARSPSLWLWVVLGAWLLLEGKR